MNIIKWEMSTDEFWDNPYPFYDKLLAREMPYINDGVWYVTQYAQVVTLFRDASTSSRINEPEKYPLDYAPAYQNKPRHSLLRKVLADTFRPQIIAQHENQIHAISCRIIEGLKANRKAEFISQFARPVATEIMALFAGIPVDDASIGISTALSSTPYFADSVGYPTNTGHDEGEAQFRKHVLHLLKNRKKVTPGGMVDTLFDAYERKVLTMDDILGWLCVVYVGGSISTLHSLGTGVYTLLQYPAQHELLRFQPELMQSAVDEMLRYESPLQLGVIRKLQETVQLGGIEIPAGSRVVGIMGAANRDPRIFPEPGKFDITRNPNNHLAFGFGAHFCMGHAIARMEIRVALTHLLEMIPDLRMQKCEPEWMPRPVQKTLSHLGKSSPWAGDRPVKWISTNFMRGLASMHVEW